MIHIRSLKKAYEGVPALDGISLEIKEGEFYGLLGPNGAGKTTTISILSTVLKPDGGDVIINGHDLKKNPGSCKRSIGVVPQEIALYNDLSAYDNLLFWGGLYKVPAPVLKRKANECLQLFGLYDRRDEKIKTYSGGMKRRINIASAILHNPQVLFMDEPTVGIDPQSRNLIYEAIEKLHREGMTIVYTTHYMEEAQRFCNRIGIMDKGKIMAEGTMDELRKLTGIKEHFEIGFADLPTDKAEALCKTIGEGSAVAGNRLTCFATDARAQLPGVVSCCNLAGLSIDRIDIRDVNLETIFLHLTGKQLRD